MESEIVSIVEKAEEYLIAPELTWYKVNDLAENLADRYEEPWRFYHVVTHLGDVTKFLVENASELLRPRVVLWAAMYHDAVYVPQAPSGVNEELSAQLAEKELNPFLPRDEVEKIGFYIRRTAGHNPDKIDSDLTYLLDSDLLILGANEAEFEAYDANILREYSHVEPVTYNRERRRILKEFFDRDRIYGTQTAHESYEVRAKLNLERKIGELAAT